MSGKKKKEAVTDPTTDPTTDLTDDHVESREFDHQLTDDQMMSEWAPNLYALLKRLETSPVVSNQASAPINQFNQSQAANESRLAEIEKAMLSLPLSYRETLDMYEGEELGLDKIAAIIDTDVPGVKWRIHRARVLLRAQLPQYFANTSPPAQTGLESETAELPPDPQLRALIKEWKLPVLSQNFERNLAVAYRAQATSSSNNHLAKPQATTSTQLKDWFSNLIHLPWSSSLTLAITSLVLACALGLTYLVVLELRSWQNPQNGIAATKSAQSPGAENSTTNNANPAVNDSTNTQRSHVDWKRLPANKKPALPRRKPTNTSEENSPPALTAPPLLERGTNSGSTLMSIKHLYVDSFGNDEWNRQLRHALMERLADSGRWKMADELSIEAADAVLEVSAKDSNTIVLVSKGKIIWQKSYHKVNGATTKQVAEDLVDSLLQLVPSSHENHETHAN